MTNNRRRKGERADGRFRVSITEGRNPDGSPHRVYFYGRSKGEAERKRDEHKARALAGVVEDKKITVNQWVDRWAEIYEIDTGQYAPYIKRLRADLGSRALADVTEADLVLSMRAYRGRSVSAATKYRSIVQRVFLKAKRNRLITFDPAEDLSLPNTARPVGHRSLEAWEVEFILANWQEHRAGLWALLMLLAGLRRGELIALSWENIDLAARQLRVCQTAVVKGNATFIEDRAKTPAGVRCIPICEALHTALSAVPGPRRSGFVCSSVRGAQLSETAFNRGWEGFNAAMLRLLNGLPASAQGRRTDLQQPVYEKAFAVRPHDLRHTFATLLYDAGVDVKSASYLLGHSDSRVTLEVYTHLSESRAKASAAAMVGVLDGVTGFNSGRMGSK